MQWNFAKWKTQSSRIVVVALLAWGLKVVSFAIGCGGSEGREGGPCHPPEGCRDYGWCDSPFACEGNTCRRFIPAPPPPGPCSDRVPSTSCAADEVAEWCPSGARAADFCAARREEDDGGTLFCCAPCWHVDGRCGKAENAFECNQPHTPSERDPRLACVLYARYDALTLADHCCAPNDACFVVADTSCGDSGHPYACTGDASPFGIGLACAALGAGGEGRRFCCSRDDDAGRD